MGLRKGDRLSISRTATIWLSQYDSLKPHVTLTRELGDDPDADRVEMERICYVEVHRALLDEIRSRYRAAKVMGDEKKLTPLLKRAEKVIRAGYDNAPEGASAPKGATQTQTARVERKRKATRTEERSEGD